MTEKEEDDKIYCPFCGSECDNAIESLIPEARDSAVLYICKDNLHLFGRAT